MFRPVDQVQGLDQALGHWVCRDLIAWPAWTVPPGTDPATLEWWLHWSADDASDLLLRPHSTTDDATPNPNAVAAGNLVRLAALTGDDKWRAQADRLLENILAIAGKNLFGHVALLNALDLRLRAAEIAHGPGRAGDHQPGKKRRAQNSKNARHEISRVYDDAARGRAGQWVAASDRVHNVPR